MCVGAATVSDGSWSVRWSRGISQALLESGGGCMVQRSEARPSGRAEAPDRLYEGYVFDLDGTIYLGDDLLPGAKRLILKLRELGKKVVFLSNNPTKDPKMYAEKLTKLG